MTATALPDASGVARAVEEAPVPTGSRRDRWADLWERRKWALIAMAVFVAVSLAFTFLWGPVVRHKPEWVIPGDVWSTFRNAHFVGWGDVGAIYDPTYGLLTFPAVVLLLTPVALVTGHFGLTESIGFWTVAHPSAWLVLGPVVLVVGASFLLAFDAMAEALGVGPRKRIWLLGAESVVAFEVVTLWGHPEDLAALGLATYALLAGTSERWRLSGWLWGAAIAFQPLVLVLVPIAVVTVPRGQRMRLAVRAVLPSAVLLAIPLATQWTMTTGAMLHQSNRTDLDHATPWVALSAHLGPHTVSAGPGRLIAVGAALVLGGVAWRRRPSLLGLVWLGALALSLRCFFESVMVPFYLGPPFALILLAAAAGVGWRRLFVATVAMAVALVAATHRLDEWPYWLVMVAMLATGLGCAWPGRAAFGNYPRPG